MEVRAPPARGALRDVAAPPGGGGLRVRRDWLARSCHTAWFVLASVRVPETPALSIARRKQT